MNIPRIKLQNLAPVAARQWTLIGLPEPVSQPTQVKVGPHRGYATGHELHVFARLPAMGEEIHEVTPDDGPQQPFAFHPWVLDDLFGLVPGFHLVVDGARHSTAALFEIAEFTPVLVKVRVRALLPGPVSIEGWLRIYTDSPIVEYDLAAVYGTTAPGQERTRAFGSLSMTLGEYAHVDWAAAKGLHQPMWSMDGGRLRWETELVAPNEWHRAQRFRASGAILCLPTNMRFPSQLTLDEDQDLTIQTMEDIQALQARMTAPIVGMCDPAAWAPVYTPLGVLPEKPVNEEAEQRRRFDSFVSRLTRSGSVLDPRPYAQPPNSGQTGEQPEFGYAAAEHAVAMWAPWALHDLSYCVEAHGLRPYANREPNTDRVIASAHPRANTYNLRPDERFSREDMLGWPNPVGWISGWVTSDGQHRSLGLLLAMWLLTRADWLRSIILGILEMEKMEYGRDRIPAPGSGMGAPRAWGRVLYSRLHAVAAGFDEFLPLAEKLINDAFIAASFNRLPETAEVQVYSDREEKYGWKDEAGNTIRCWLPWQEAIACVSFFAAWKMLGNEKAKSLAIRVARTICRWGYTKVHSQWHTAYGVRWRTDEEGAPLPIQSYNLALPNFDVFVSGMQRWQNPALKVLLALEPNGPDSARAREILAYYGAPQSWDDSRWRAV